jgi:CRP-like cAMP-binding protein
MAEDSPFDTRQHFSLWMRGMCACWAEVIHLGTRTVLQKDQTLFGRGERARGLYFNARGLLRFLSCDAEGREAILFYITENNLLGEAALFNRMPVFAMFEAVEDCVLYYFDERTVKDRILPNYPHLVNNLIEYMAYKVGVLLHHHCEIINPDVRGKVSRLLFDIVRHSGDANRASPRITQEEMATALGLHRATFSRIIRELKQEGILQKATKHEIVVRDMEALARYADSPFAL